MDICGHSQTLLVHECHWKIWIVCSSQLRSSKVILCLLVRYWKQMSFLWSFQCHFFFFWHFCDFRLWFCCLKQPPNAELKCCPLFPSTRRLWWAFRGRTPLGSASLRVRCRAVGLELSQWINSKYLTSLSWSAWKVYLNWNRHKMRLCISLLKMLWPGLAGI